MPSCLSFVGWHSSYVPSWQMYAGYRRWPPSSVVCWQSNVLGQEITQPVQWPLFCHRRAKARTVCLNSFGNRTSPSDNSNDRWKRLCLVSWAAAPCVWTLRALSRNLLTYLLICKCNLLASWLIYSYAFKEYISSFGCWSNVTPCSFSRCYRQWNSPKKRCSFSLFSVKNAKIVHL